MPPPYIPPGYPPHRTEEREQYPERYIFLLLFFIAFTRLVKALKKYRREEFHPDLDELDVMEGSNRVEAHDGPSISSRSTPYSSVPNSPSFSSEDLLRLNHYSGYESQPSSPFPLPYRLPRNTPSLPTEILRAHRIHHLLTQLHLTTSIAQNDPQDVSHRLRIKELRRHLAEAMRIDVGSPNADYALRPPPEHAEPPPAYSDAVQVTEGV